jgi:hypothetical protein
MINAGSYVMEWLSHLSRWDCFGAQLKHGILLLEITTSFTAYPDMLATVIRRNA